MDKPAPDCCNSRHPKPAVAGHATFTITGKPRATLEEITEEPMVSSKN